VLANNATKDRIDKLLDDLDSKNFNEREKAAKELEKLGERAEPDLRAALAGKPNLETRKRLEELLARLEAQLQSPDHLRGLRAIEALEHIATSEAKKLLQEIAKGAPEARLTQEAKASLGRLK